MRAFRLIPCVLVLASLLLPSRASAGPLTLTLLDLTSNTKAVVTDNGVGDLDAAIDSVSYFGALGNIVLSFTTGHSSQSPALLGLTSVNLQFLQPGAIKLSLFDDTYVGTGQAAALSSVQGTLITPGAPNSTVTAQSWINGELVLNSVFGPGSFQATAYETVVASGVYAMLSEVTIDFRGILGAATFDLQTAAGQFTKPVSPAPISEPGTLLLMGAGLVAVAKAARRRLTAAG